MLVWILTTGEQLPGIDGNNVRLWRSVLLTNELLKRGHQVVRWSSAFDHTRKIHRFPKSKDLIISEKYKLKFLKSIGYSKNISLKRLIDHYFTAKTFEIESINEQIPDIILCSLPTINLCVKATEYGKKFNVPVILDGRDMWPDIFEEAFPKYFKFLNKVVLWPMYRKIKMACKNATYLTGISDPYIDWELNYAGREKTKYDISFSHGYVSDSPSIEDQEIAFLNWEKFGIKSNNFNVCLFSAMGNVIDIDTVIDAAKNLKETHPNVNFILCGDGDKLLDFKSKAKNLPNIFFPGWVNSTQIWTLMRLCKVGILPYWNINNYKMNIPNKPIEYLSAGLPIVSSVGGLVKELIEYNNCGAFYENQKPEQLALLLKNLFENKNSYLTLSKNAKNVFDHNFKAENIYSNMAEYLFEIYKNLKYEK